MLCQQPATEGHGYIVRAAQDRALVEADGTAAGRLFATARQPASLGEINLVLRAQEEQAARTARLSLCVTRVSVRSPW